MGLHKCNGKPGFTRRTALSGLAAVIPFAKLEATTPTERRNGLRRAVDVHHHLVPPFYKEGARAWLTRTASNVEEVLAWTPERSISAMNSAGGDTATGAGNGGDDGTADLWGARLE